MRGAQPPSHSVVVNHLVVKCGVSLKDTLGETSQGKEQEKQEELDLIEAFPRISAASSYIKALEPGFLNDDAIQEPGVLSANWLACTSKKVIGGP